MVRGTLGITRVDGNIENIVYKWYWRLLILRTKYKKITVAEKRNGSGIIRRSSGKRGLNRFKVSLATGVLRRP